MSHGYWFPQRPEELDPPVTVLKVIVSCLMWALNSGPLQEQYMFSTAEPSLQPSVDALKTWSHLRKFPTPSSISC